jgi:sarcosine oxidase gamma subunit
MSTIAQVNLGIDAAGLSIQPVASVWMAAIRFFDPAGEFVNGLAGRVGGPMPGPLQALRYAADPAGAAPQSQILLASRSPNETLLLCDQAWVLAALEDFAAGRSDGCVVNQTGAYRVWEIAGDRAPDFLARLGSASLPALGEARMSRVAELTVMTLSVEAGSTLVLVDRLYSEHLAGWMAETLRDF